MTPGVFGSENLYQSFGAIIGITLIGGAIVYSTFFIKCPRCNFKFGQSGILRPFILDEEQRIDFCPHCEVSFDEQV